MFSCGYNKTLKISVMTFCVTEECDNKAVRRKTVYGNYKITARSRVLLEQPRVAQALKNFPTLHGTRSLLPCSRLLNIKKEKYTGKVFKYVPNIISSNHMDITGH
jgi:hypothetical protein